MASVQASAARRQTTVGEDATVGVVDRGALSTVWLGDVTGIDEVGLIGTVFEQAAKVSARRLR